MTTPTATWSLTTPQLAQPAKLQDSVARAARPESKREVRRKDVGEFVGNIFYGTLLREMSDSKVKGKYFHGGRGEEVFRGQLNMELAKRMGQSAGDPIAEKMYEALNRAKKQETPVVSAKGFPLKAGGGEGISLKAEPAKGFAVVAGEPGGYGLDSIRHPQAVVRNSTSAAEAKPAVSKP